MSSIPVTELDLISALQAVGALNKSDETSRLFESKSTLNDTSIGTASSISSDSFPIFERSESLRIIHNLVEGLLRVQTRDSSTAPRHLDVVLSSLFKFLSDSNSDVRIAADEGLNKLIKFLRSSMTHLILFELLMELKRNQNSRSVSAALSKFAALSPQIRTSKRRFYAVNLLPILISICEQEDDLLFENLIDSFRQIAIELFYYANEKELRNFLRSQFTRLSSDSALVRRSIAQLLVITCQSSRAPLTLLRYLLHLILTEMDSLIEDSQSEPIKINCDKSATSFSSTAYWTGLFNAIRYLSIGWDQFSKNFTKTQTFLDLNISPPSSVRLDILNTVHSRLIEAENPEMPNPDDSIPFSLNHHNPNTEVDSLKKLSKMNYSDFDNKLWSKAFFMCLHHASNLSTSNSLMVQTASLEAFVQLLTVRRPFFLFPQSWLTCITSCLSRSSPPASPFNHQSNYDKADNDKLEDNVISESSTDQHKLHKNELRIDTNIFREADVFIPTNQFSRTFSLESVDNKSSSSDFQSVDNRDTFFIRSASSSSLFATVKVDLNETVSNEQEVQNQLSIVRARLARDEDKSMNNKNGDIFSDLGYDIIYDSSRNAESTQNDEIHDSLIGNDHIHGQESASVYCPKFCPLNLIDLISRLNQDEPINLTQIDWLLPFLLLSFDMMPSTQEASTIRFQWPRPLNSPRTSLHLLVINCLVQLAQLNPIIFFAKLNGNQCCPNGQLNMEEVQWPTANDVILEFLNNSTDPQLQGQLCILIGNLIASYLVWQNVNYHEFDYVLNDYKSDESATLEHLFTKLESYLNINVSGITLRWALSGLRTCSNVLLSCADRDSSLHLNRSDVSSDKLLVHRFLKVLTSIVIHASRHPYRLVRRELLILVTELNWASIGYLEGTLKTLEFAKSPLFSVKPIRLIDLTWTECWRILCDSDPDLRHIASIALVSLASNLTSGIGDNLGIPTGGLLSNRIGRSLHYWLSQPYSLTKSKVSCYNLVGSLGVHGLPPCLSTLPMEMDVGPIGRQFCQSQMSQLLYMESESNKASNEVTSFHASSTGATRLFRDCLTALMELPCSSSLPEDHYMLFGVVGCLNQLIGFSHLLSHSHLWFDSVCASSPASPDSTSSKENPIQPPRRSRLSLLSWHCLTLLSSAPITSIDLELQSSLLNLCTGCVIRWSVYTLLDKSPKSKNNDELSASNNQQPFTRYALAFMQHLMRVCCVLWHVLEAIPIPQHSQFDSVTTKIPISSIYSGISESFIHSVANLAQTSNNFSMNKVNQETITSSAATSNSGISNTDASSKKRNYGTKLSGSLRKHLSIPRYSPTFTSSLGYFANLPQYISLYKTLKVAYKSFKISADLSGSNDRLMNLLQTCLYSFGRLLENLHFNEIAPYADELLVYLTSFYNWKPGPCLELSTQLLRAFVGTNLCSQWDDQLSQLYSDALNFSFYRQDTKNEKETYSRVGSQNTIDLHVRKLLGQNKTSTNYLWDQSVLDENKACCWITIPELRQAPISAWIRFARQRRIPVGLEYASSTDRVLAATSNQTTTVSALKIKPDVQLFFKRLEHIVLRGMENYKWINCYSLQAGILDLLIHLIYLRMNYCQLDVQQKFLNIVVNHCENLASEMQRLETITTMNVGSLNHHYFKGNHQLNSNKRLTSSGLSTSVIRECSSYSSSLFPVVNLREPTVLQQHERLVNAIFRFLVTLTYQHRIISSSSTSQQSPATPTQPKHVDSGSSESSAASATSTITESENSVGSRFVELSQVVHLAETLAAETRDPGSVVLTAMVPVIVDLFVIQQPLSQRTSKQAETIDQTRRHQIQQANAQRETILSFLLRRIGHLPASYDQISLILEEVNLSSKLCRSENNIFIIDCLIQISNHILSHLAAGAAQIDSRADFDALQRLLNHLVMIFNSLAENEASQMVWNAILKVEEVFYVELDYKILLDNCNPLHFIRWTVKQCFCSRFLFHLFSRVVKLSEPTNFVISKQIAEFFEHSLITFHQIICGIKVLLLFEPHLVGQIVSLQFDCSVKSANLILLIHLSLTYLLNLIELVKSDFGTDIVWNNQHTTSLIQAIHKQIYSIGKFEPLLCLLWHQLVFSNELNIVDILLENYCTKSLSDNSDKQHSNNILSKIVLPNLFTDCSWTSINLELVNQSIVISYIQSQLNSNNTDIIVQNLLSPPLSDLRTSYSYQKRIIRLLNMWHSGEPIVCNLMSQLSNSKDAFKQINDGFMDCLSLMSLEQIRFILNNMFGKIHAESATCQLDTLFNKFIVPQCEVLQFEKDRHCSTCIRSILPISLRLMASINACNILEWILKNYDNKSKDRKCVISHDILLNYHLRLTTCGNNLKANQLLGLLDRLIKYTDEKPEQNEEYNNPNALPHCSFDSVIKLSNETSWLLNSAKDLLKQCDLSAVLNGIRLIHALSECTNINEKKISDILDSICLRCSPLMLYYALVLGSSSVSSSLLPNSLFNTSEIGNQITNSGTKISRITPCVNVLFRVAQKILFKNIQNIVTNSSELFKEVADPNLTDSVQTYLTGLSFALLEFLRILPHVPLGDLVPIEKETDALSFLLILIEFFFCSMGYPYGQITSVCAGSSGFTTDDTFLLSQALRKDNIDNAPITHFMISITLMQTSLRLLNYVLQTALNRSVKGVDLFGGDGKRILSIFLLFVWMIDKSACLSEYTTVWSKSTNEHMINAVQRILDEYTQQSVAKSLSLSPELSITILLNNLLIPLYPPIMGLWWPDPICASTLSDFCATVASSASYAALNSTSSNSTMNQTKLGNTEGGFIQPCQVISKCRLLRCNLIQSTGLDIVNQLNMCTSGISRLLHTLNASSSHSYSSINMSFHESNDMKTPDSFNSFVNLDLDHLTVNITRLNAMGWLDRREFERIWTNYLELLSSASDAQHNVYPIALESGNMPITSSEELIECNQSIVIGLRGLTRLLMDTSLKPQPGDTLYSRLHHHSRLDVPHFFHTKLGRKLASLLTLIERERDCINNCSDYSMSCITYSEYMNRIDKTGDLELINLERLTNPFSDGPSQFAVDRLIRRLRVRGNSNSTGRSSVDECSSENEKILSTTVNPNTFQSNISLPVSKSNHRPVNILTLQNYEDPLFSCLQSLQLFYHSCLKPEPFPVRSSDNQDMNSLLLGTSNGVDLFTPSIATISPSILNKNTAASKQIKQHTPTTKGPAFDVWQSILQSAIILSDLFTTQEQFIWLNDHLQDAMKQLPTWSEFQSPIHSWLALGIAKCTAVLELLNSSPNNSSQVLQSNSLEPAVKQTKNAINSSFLTVQNAGLHSAMYLLHAALLIRTQPYQQQLQQHSPPTGSPLLNELYTYLCSYLEKKINTVFCIPMTTANLPSTETLVNQDLSVTSTTGPSGMKRFMQAVLHPGAASKVTNVERESSVMRFSNIDLTDHIEQHQLIILSTAFFLTEHFSGPPVYPILTDSYMGITEMLSGLTAILFRLTPCMLSDAPIISQSKRTEDTKYSGLSTGTTVDLSYSFPVHMAWCQGIERLIYSGRLGKGAIGSLQKMCINRIRTCCSPHISFLAIRLLLTCIYANLGRLSDRIHHYRRIHHTQLSDNKSNTDISNKVNTNNKVDAITVSNEGTSDTIKPISKISDSFPPESLPSSILQDSENIAALTQESLNCLWEKLRGGISVVNSSVQHPHRLQISCPMSAWTSVMEARLVARLLPLISNDVTQTVISLLNTPESMLSPSIIGCDSLPNSVLNKALGEFARSDHSFPNLAASNLTQLFESFMQNENGQDLIRQWILLSFPTLLSRQPSYLAIWACTVCLLAAATDGKIRAAIFLCYTYKLTTIESKSVYDIPTDNNSLLAITSNSSVYLSDLLCLAAYHFVTDGLLKPLIKSESEILLYNKRQAERNHFLTLIKDHCDAISSSNNNTGTPTTTTTTNPPIKYSDNSYSINENSTVFHQLYTIIKQQVANNSS